VEGIGGATSYIYDANGRVTATVDALNRSWASTYDALGRLTATANPLGQGTAIKYSDSGNDPRPVQVTSPALRITAMAYDPAGNLLSLTDPGGAITRMAYNARGDVSTIINPLMQQTNIAYNAIGLPLQVTDALGRTTALTYDVLGRLATSTNAAGETTRYTYDSLDRVVGVVDPLNQTTAMSYDAAGRLLTVTDAKGSVSRFEYDSFGRRSAEVAPDGRRTVYTYRADNLLASVTRPDNTAVSYEYDNNKRVTRETAGSEVITYTYNAVNQLTSASGPGGTVSYTYDNAGRIATETSGGRTHTITRNAEGERIQLDYLGQSQTYTRDARGLVTRIATPAGNFDFNFDALGRRTRLAYPNGSAASYGFDAAGQLTSLTHAGVFNAGFAYSFDAAGRITHITGGGLNSNYTYDALGRLTRAAQGTSNYSYTLDPVGNILDGGRVHDVNHRLIADASKNYSYDLRGNLTLEQDRATGARVVYSWNVKNQLLRVDFFADATTTTPTRTLQYDYDPLGRRASKTDNGTVQRFIYDGDDLVGTLDANGSAMSTTVFSGMLDEALSSTTGGTPKTLYSDHLGSVIGVAEGATPTHAYSYGPYGETATPSSEDSVPFRYTGREKDTDSLYYYRARYYHTGMGRFISADPIGLAGGLSLYAYAGANPISVVDPSGTQPGSPDWCRRQAERIRNIQQKIQERIGELDENPLGLPEACPGDDVRPSLSRRGHRKLINMDKANLAAQQALYAAFCGGGPPPVPVPAPEPERSPQPAPPSNSPFSLEYWQALTGLTGAALIAYLIVSEGSRLFPPRNLVPVP
jgi:RHS repeat-associated protein